MRELTDDELIDKAMRIVDKLIARDEADDLDRAAGWIAIATDPEWGTTNHVGPFVNVGDALAYAGHWETELNGGGDPLLPYKVAIKPIMEPEEMLR